MTYEIFKMLTLANNSGILLVKSIVLLQQILLSVRGKVAEISTVICCAVSVCQKTTEFFFHSSNTEVKTVRIQINAIQFIFIEADIRTFAIRITE